MPVPADVVDDPARPWAPSLAAWSRPKARQRPVVQMDVGSLAIETPQRLPIHTESVDVGPSPYGPLFCRVCGFSAPDAPQDAPQNGLAKRRALQLPL